MVHPLLVFFQGVLTGKIFLHFFPLCYLVFYILYKYSTILIIQITQ